VLDYKLKFKDEAEANQVVAEATKDLHPSQYVIYVIGIPKSFQYDENDLEAPPIVTILDDGWFVDLRLREKNSALDAYRVYPKTPLHAFS